MSFCDDAAAADQMLNAFSATSAAAQNAKYLGFIAPLSFEIRIPIYARTVE
jgi:hypothetical protein